MSLVIIKRRERVECVERNHEFHWADEPGAGFSFPVDEDGNIIITETNRDNVILCQRNDDGQIVDDGICDNSWSYVEDAVGKCSCGREVVLTMSVAGNDCGCGRIYNASGQELAPRHLWGEETGETYSDIIAGGVDD